jgi:hypothetical protein
MNATQLATLLVGGYAAYMVGGRIGKTFGGETSPSEIERSMIENKAIVPTIDPQSLSGGFQGALYRDVVVGNPNVLNNASGGLGVRPQLTDVLYDSAFASGLSRVTDEPYQIVSHDPVNLQPSFTQYGGGPVSYPPVKNQASSVVVKNADNEVNGSNNTLTNSTQYSGVGSAVQGVDLVNVDSYKNWNTPCCRVCPEGSEAWCDALQNARTANLPNGQRLSPYQNAPLLPDPYSLKASSPQQNNSYIDSTGRIMTIGEWSKHYDISVSGDYSALAVARDGSHTEHLRRI